MNTRNRMIIAGILLIIVAGLAGIGMFVFASDNSSDNEDVSVTARKGLSEDFSTPLEERLGRDNCIQIIVCGVDGRTYSTPCAAEDAGVAIACNQACPCNDEDPGRSPDNVQIPSPEPVRPSELCSKFVSCGIDGITYESGCAAQEAGVTIACTGTCPCTQSETNRDAEKIDPENRGTEESSLEQSDRVIENDVRICPAQDSDNDGDVDFRDFVIFAAFYNRGCTTDTNTREACGSIDVNNDGKVSTVDFFDFAQKFGSDVCR